MKLFFISLVVNALIFNLQAEDFLPQSFNAEFEQTYISSLKGNIKKGNGSVWYQYPSKIRFETTAPSAITFVSNGTKAWYYRPPFIEGEPGELTESSAKDGTTSFTKFFDILKNGLVSGKVYSVEKKNNVHILEFQKSFAAELNLKTAKLQFKSPEKPSFLSLESVTLVDRDGKETTVKFKKISSGLEGMSSPFEFKAPANTKITR